MWAIYFAVDPTATVTDGRAAGHPRPAADEVARLADYLVAMENSRAVNTLPATDEHAGLALVRLKVSNSFLISRVTRRSAHLLGLEVGNKTWVQIKSVALI